MGYPVDVVDEVKAIEVIESAWENHRSMHIVTLNAEMVVQAQQDPDLDRIIRHAHLIIPDGAGVVWAVRLAGEHIERLPGIELSSAALSHAARYDKRVVLLGGKPDVVKKLTEDLPVKHPGLDIVYSHDGFFTAEDAESIVDEIAQLDPDLILVALGVPKQEYFIDQWSHAFPRAVMIGVGGSFDVWAGQIKRAPKFMRDLHLEWLYRVVIEPWRIKRIGASLPNFGLQVLQDRMLGGSKNKTKTNGKR